MPGKLPGLVRRTGRIQATDLDRLEAAGVTRFWHELWPQVLAVSFAAGVLGNLTASALLGTPAVWSLHRKLNRHHAERMALEAAHHETVMAEVGEARKDFALTVQAVTRATGGKT
jgi:hypothetical protein